MTRKCLYVLDITEMEFFDLCLFFPQGISEKKYEIAPRVCNIMNVIDVQFSNCPQQLTFDICITIMDSLMPSFWGLLGGSLLSYHKFLWQNVNTCSTLGLRFRLLKQFLLHMCCYIITQVILAFWLVLAYDLLEDRRTDDDSARFKFFWILNLNQSQFFAKHSNQSVRFIFNRHKIMSVLFSCLSKWRNLK